MQSKKQSFNEQCVSVFIGIVVSYAAQYVIFPVLNIPVSHSENFILMLFFTVISFARGYFVRRLFNWWDHR